MSTITEFFGSPGLTSPNALPTIFSYCPTPGHEKPPKVGDSVVVIWTLVMRASAAGAASIALAASAMFRRRAGFISSSPLSNTSALPRRRDLNAERIAANVFRVLRKHPALANQSHQPLIHPAHVFALVLDAAPARSRPDAGLHLPRAGDRAFDCVNVRHCSIGSGKPRRQRDG